MYRFVNDFYQVRSDKGLFLKYVNCKFDAFDLKNFLLKLRIIIYLPCLCVAYVRKFISKVLLNVVSIILIFKILAILFRNLEIRRCKILINLFSCCGK